MRRIQNVAKSGMRTRAIMFLLDLTRSAVLAKGTGNCVQSVIYPSKGEMFKDAPRRAIVDLSLSATQHFLHACALESNDANRCVLLRGAVKKREDEKKMWLSLETPDPLGALWRQDVAMVGYHVELKDMLVALDKLLEVRSSCFLNTMVWEAMEINLQIFGEIGLKCVQSNPHGFPAGVSGHPRAYSNQMLDEEVARVRSFWVWYDRSCGARGL